MDIKNIAPPDKWTYVINRKTGEVNYVNTEIKMNFIEAVKLLELDENIKLMRRSKDLTIFTGYGILQGISKQGHTGFKLFLNDILAEDWHVVKNEKLHTFEEALKAYKSGNNIRRKDHGMMHHEAHCDFDRDDVMANDWIIIDKEETK